MEMKFMERGKLLGWNLNKVVKNLKVIINYLKFNLILTISWLSNHLNLKRMILLNILNSLLHLVMIVNWIQANWEVYLELIILFILLIKIGFNLQEERDISQSKKRVMMLNRMKIILKHQNQLECNSIALQKENQWL